MKQYQKDMEDGVDEDQVGSLDFFLAEDTTEREEKVKGFKFDEPEVDTRFNLPILDFSDPSTLDLMEVESDDFYGGLSEA
jgi:hypothetical protein